jgi:hypothetical protein
LALAHRRGFREGRKRLRLILALLDWGESWALAEMVIHYSRLLLGYSMKRAITTAAVAAGLLVASPAFAFNGSGMGFYNQCGTGAMVI